MEGVVVGHSLDSWDLENLRYLRKLSTRSVQPDTLSYISDTDTTDSCAPEVDSFLDNALNFNPKPHTPFQGHLHPQKSLVSQRKVLHREKLADCYSMEVVVVRNDSIQPQPQSHLPPPPLVSSSPSSLSSSDSFSSAIQKGFFDMGVGKQRNNPIFVDLPQPTGVTGVSRRPSRTSQGQPGPALLPQVREVREVREITENFQQFQVQPQPSLISYTRICRPPPLPLPGNDCPMCGGCGQQSFNLLRQEVEDASVALTYGGEPPPLPHTPLTPSPFRLQNVPLRRGIVPLTSALPKQSNFGLTPNGHLVIDYSANWTNLESYVQRLESGGNGNSLDLKSKKKGSKSTRSWYSS